MPISTASDRQSHYIGRLLSTAFHRFVTRSVFRAHHPITFTMVANDSSAPSSSSPTKQKTSKDKRALADSIPSFRRGHLPKEDDVERLRVLTRPHVESFNFFLETGLPNGIKDIEPAEMDIFDAKKFREDAKSIDWDEISTVRFWVEDVKVNKPIKPSSAGRNPKLLPRECRERSAMYSGQIFGKFCYQIIQRWNGVMMEGTPVKIAKTFGNLPIMVGSKACHLEGLMPNDLVKLKEEVCGHIRIVHGFIRIGEENAGIFYLNSLFQYCATGQ